MSKAVITEKKVIEVGIEIPDGFTPKEYLRKVAVDKFYALRMERIADDNSYATEGLSKEVDILLDEIAAVDAEDTAAGMVATSLWIEQNGQDYIISTGRGSAAGRYLPFALGFSKVDPGSVSLMFERFLDPSRNSAPDIDTNFDDKIRKKTMKFLKKKYGTKRSLLSRLFRRK